MLEPCKNIYEKKEHKLFNVTDAENISHEMQLFFIVLMRLYAMQSHLLIKIDRSFNSTETKHSCFELYI
jgi:hypothetical protein